MLDDEPSYNVAALVTLTERIGTLGFLLRSKSPSRKDLVTSPIFAALVLPKLPGCVDENPVKMAFKILNVVLDARMEINDNKGELQSVLEETLELLSAVLVTMETGSDVRGGIVNLLVEGCKMEIAIQLERITDLNDGLISSFDTYEDYKTQLTDICRKIGGSANRFKTSIVVTPGILVDELREEEIEENLRKLRNYLAPSYKADHRFIYNSKSALNGKASCTPGTRIRILLEIMDWANDSTVDSQPVFWLTGQKRAEKSTIIYTIAKQFENSEQPTALGASFFCSQQFEETRRLERIVPTIAFQLASRCNPYGIALRKVDTSNAVDYYDSKEQIQTFLFKPWMSLAGRHELKTHLVIIDALDEIENWKKFSFLQGFLESIENRERQRHWSQVSDFQPSARSFRTGHYLIKFMPIHSPLDCRPLL